MKLTLTKDEKRLIRIIITYRDPSYTQMGLILGLSRHTVQSKVNRMCRKRKIKKDVLITSIVKSSAAMAYVYES